MRSSVVVGRVWLMADGTAVSHSHWNSTELQCVSISLQLFVGFVCLFVFSVFARWNLPQSVSLYFWMYLLLQANSRYLICKGPVISSVSQNYAVKMFYMDETWSVSNDFRSNLIDQTMPFIACFAHQPSASFCTCWDQRVSFCMNRERCFSISICFLSLFFWTNQTKVSHDSMGNKSKYY